MKVVSSLANKTWKKVLIVSLACIGFGAAVFGVIAGCEYLTYRTRGDYSGLEKRISEHITMVGGWKGGYSFCRLKDTRTGEFTTPKLNHVFLNEYSDDSLVVYRTLDYQRGYINTQTGRIVIKAQYDRAWNFSEGLGAVVKEGEIIFLNEQGEKAFDATFPLSVDECQADFAFQFHDGLCTMIGTNRKWGMIDKQGQWVVEPVYNTISTPHFGYRIVLKGDLYGLLTIDGQTALATEYDVIRESLHYHGFYIGKDGYARIVDKDLKTVVPFAYDGLYRLDYIHEYRSDDTYDDNGNLIAHTPEYWRYDIGMYSGVIDRHGNVIIPAKYFMVRMVDENLFEVEVTCDGERILYDRQGRMVGKANS